MTWVIGAAAFWFVYFRLKDSRNEFPVPASALVSGTLAIPVALAGYWLLGAFGCKLGWSDLAGPWPRAVLASLAVGVVEECAKLFPVLLLALAGIRPTWHLAAYAAVGFSAGETASMLFGGELGGSILAFRSVVAPFSHAMFAIAAGIGLQHAFARRSAWPALIGLGVAAITHAGYDFGIAQFHYPYLIPAATVAALWLAMKAQQRLEARHGQEAAAEKEE
jgi:RsiW-degrading membrane proteinase PrsW (M82 family)